MIAKETALPGLSIFTPAQCETIHHGSLEVLRKTGVRMFYEPALRLLKQSGSARIDGNRVRFEPALVEWAVAQTPSRIALCRRGTPDVIVPLEGHKVSFGTGSDCLTYLDPRTGERRPFRLTDVTDCVRVVDAMPEIQFCMSMGIPSDVKERFYRKQFAVMLENTVKPVVFVCDDRADCEAIVAMASVAAGGTENLRLNPSLLLYSEPSSPLRQSESALAKLMYMAEHHLPVVHSPAPVQGGTAPVTLAGALVMANAEVLSALVVHQLTRTGAPFVYGCGMHQLDMKTTISVYTSPEFVLARTAVAEMGRYYGMPTWGYAGDSNSCLVDEQAASEATFSIMAALLAGNNLTHDIGYLESGLTTSPEMIVLCDEIISMLRHYIGGISLDAESMAMDVIHQVGPGGSYLDTDHTFNNFRRWWTPKVFSRLGGKDWAASGHKRLGDRVREKTVEIISSHTPEPLGDNVRQEIESILKEE